MMRDKKTCAVDGCSNPFSSKGYCRMHYQRWKKTGSTLTPSRIRSRSSDVSKFFNVTIPEHDGDDCLVWPFARTPDGYALMRYKGRCGIVSRFVCEIFNGPAISKDLQAAHSCGNGHLGCVNRRHLSWKTPMENTQDRIMFGRKYASTGSGRYKLNPSEVSEIRRLRGVCTQEEIGRRFGVGQSAISDIFSGRTWSDKNYAARLKRHQQNSNVCQQAQEQRND